MERGTLFNIKKILLHARNLSPYYQKRFKDIDIDNLTQKSFQDIPILNKREIVGIEDSLLTQENNSALSKEYTSGSTGNPLTCYKGRSEVFVKTKDLWGLRKHRGNIDTKDLYGMFYAFTEDDFCTDSVQYIDNKIYLSMLDMTPQKLDLYYSILVEKKPKWLLGVPSALYIFSNHIIEKGYDAENLSIQYIETNGEMLFDYQAKAIEKAFGKIVFNHYGCREFWCLGMSCQSGNIHSLSKRFYYEVINQDSKGFGELVITDLYNKTWPLIRYFVGDLVRLRNITCECGDTNPVIDVTGGRTQEYLKIGEWIANPILFHYAVMKVNRSFGDAIRQFKVTQYKEDALLIELVKGKLFTDKTLDMLRMELKEKLPPDVTLDIKDRDILKFKSNKHKYFIPYDGRGVHV
ncbi:phenylacetate--CoA ligase family protein [Bacillus sp. MUM 13]|uniref:phenylacetate--CoA ligase family protein n=1 Tax=Bacillus sp. MUM 13 TaxID=1678001 RepID=UPI0008F5C649|nr:phenylacetate--CoA ligase family protein [Bacillus sp. MUM 13]OIK06815.1 hypothetical protein BIV59_21335 [Bacillus sp. MUM 13]